jgi:hypothetical protein
MATYIFKWRLLSAPVAGTDGSGRIVHSLSVSCQVDGAGSWTEIPAHAREVQAKASDLKTVMDMPQGTTPEKTAKALAYRRLIVDSLQQTVLTPETRWSVGELAQFMDANLSATTEAARADTFLRTTMGYTYPVDFGM